MWVLYLAGVYFDVITLLAVSHLAGYFISAIADVPLLVLIAVAVLISALAARFGFSLGQWLVNELRGLREAGQMSWRGWVTLFVGGLSYLEATKHFVRWTQMDRPMPFMGFIPEGYQQIVFSLSFGVVSLLIGVLILRLYFSGKILGVLTSLVMIASAFVSWNLLPEAIERQMIARRAVQGLPVDPEHIAFMQAWFPWFLLGTQALMIVLFLVCYSRRRQSS